ILLRKGGIAEGPHGFRPEHSEFWLLPTFLHELPAALQPADRCFYDLAEAKPPAAGHVSIALYARVIEIAELRDQQILPALSAFHVYGRDTVRQRFDYRHPGLWLMAVRL